MSAAQQPRSNAASEAKASRCAVGLTSCLCLKATDRHSVKDAMFHDYSDVQPSLFQRAICQCGPRARTPSNIHEVPELKGLGGITLQSGEHLTAGSLQTLKWSDFDRDAHTLTVKPFGGFPYSCVKTSSTHVGVWTEPIIPVWCCLVPLARCANYTYHMKFSQDWKKADIEVWGNPLPLCCVCVPCLPPWCKIPGCLVKFEMEQKEETMDGALDGTAWNRYSACCGGPRKLKYCLEEVYDYEGNEGKFFSQIEEAPELMMITH